MNFNTVIEMDPHERYDYLKDCVYRNKKTGKYISGRTISFFSKKTKITHFVYGQGALKFNPKEWTEERPEVYDKSKNDDIRVCVEKYGYDTACYILSGFGPYDCASSFVRYACLKNIPSDATFLRFENLFRIPLTYFMNPYLCCFGIFSFNVIEFEKFLVMRHGYDKESEESLNNFISRTFGPGVSEFILKNLLTT